MITDHTKDDLNIDEKGEVNIPTEVVVGTANDIFGDKIYGITQTMIKEVDEQISHIKPNGDFEKIKDETSKEDIFDYIPPKKTNQIYTRKRL